MALIVETGTGSATADSYNSVAGIAAYAEAKGLEFPTSPLEPAEQAARRATTWLDATYRDRFPGTRVNGRSQALQWPREDAEDIDGEDIASNAIPAEIKDAHCEASIRELANPGSLSPDFIASEQIVREKIGPMDTEYRETNFVEDVTPVVTTIDNILSSLVGKRSNTKFLLRA